MIIRMKKYVFLVYHHEYKAFLNDVRDRGLLHLKLEIPRDTEDENLQLKLQLMKRLTTALRFLENRKTRQEFSARELSGAEVLEQVEALQQEKTTKEQELQNLEKELHQLEPWGNFSRQNIRQLRNAGWYIHFYSSSPKQWEKEWMDNYHAFIISETGSLTYFVTVTNSEIPPGINAELMELPGHSPGEIHRQLEVLTQRLEEIKQRLDELSVNGTAPLEHLFQKVKQNFDFDRVLLHTPYTAEEKVAVLEGFIPENEITDFDTFLNNRSIYYESWYPDQKEQVPVLLKNNRFSRLFETIGNLYALPGYQEMDLTPYYAPFYWLFFGFCLGDIGYGILLTLAGFIMAPRVKKALKGPMKLLGMLGLAAILFGIIGGTFFGINLYEEHFSFYGPLADRMAAHGKTINDYLFSLALMLGGVQILFGMAIKIMNQKIQYGWRYALGTAGWFVLIVGSLIVYLLRSVEINPTISKIVLYVVLIVGFAGAFVFNHPKRNIFANMGAGLWDAYNMTTGLMGDLLSYIRLFALGISSAILGYVFNSLAVQLSPEIPVVRIIVMIIILLIGHSINLFMSTLGSFVHPMRLTFVEFYKNAGFAGGGVRYTPFGKKISE